MGIVKPWIVGAPAMIDLGKFAMGVALEGVLITTATTPSQAVIKTGYAPIDQQGA